MNVAAYLTAYGVEFNIKEAGSRTLYRLNRCLFNESHGRNEAFIQQDASGMVSYSCSHNSCKGHTWAEARAIISKDESLARFCEGYDPDRAGSGRRRRADPAAAPAAAADPEKPFLHVSERGRVTFNSALMADWLRAKLDPILNEGKDFGGMFYGYRATDGVWKTVPEAVIRKMALEALGEHATPRRISDTVSLLQDRTYRDIPEKILPDPMWLNLKNQMLHLPDMVTATHAPEFLSRVQLPVVYDPAAKCSLWMDTLAMIFADDLAKADVLQEFFGYCLFPRIIFPAALFCIGPGSNGKGTVQRVLESLLGEANVSHISLQRMEMRFGPVELKDKLLNACGETATTPLETTQFKAIAAADRVQCEVKFGKDITFVPIAKHYISMNQFPGVKDKTDAFFRRVLVMEFKQRFEGEQDDKYLAQKLEAEANGIFGWAVEGLKRVIKNGEIKQPESLVQAKTRFRARTNPVISFVEECCVIGEMFSCSPPILYKKYCEWCDESGVRRVGKLGFYENITTTFGLKKERPRFGSDQSTVKLFRGLGVRMDIVDPDSPTPKAVRN